MNDCTKCEGWKPKLRKGQRCDDCAERFKAYVEADWGLHESIDQRNLNQSLGLCFLCGGGLEEAVQWEERLCDECRNNSTNSRWAREQTFKGYKTSDPNPYSRVWDNHEVDNAGYLTPGYGDIANRMYSKARYHQRLSEQGGPKGREHAADAAIYFRIADGMKEKEQELRRMR